MNSVLSEVSTSDLIFARRCEGYIPGSDPFNRVVGAFNGGAFAVATEVGMALEMEELNLLSSLDVLYGESGGGGVAIAAGTGKLTEAEFLFAEDLPNNGFIRVRRAFVGKPIIKFASLREKLEDCITPEELKASKFIIGLGYTDMERWEPVIVTNRNTAAEDFLDATVWGMHMAWVGGKAPRNKQGDRVADIGFSSVDTLVSARQFARTCVQCPEAEDPDAANIRILNFRNQPAGTMKRNKLNAFLGRTWVERNGMPGGGDLYDEFTYAQPAIVNRDPDDLDIIIAPLESDKRPTTFTRNSELLREGVELGRRACKIALGYSVKGVETNPELKKKLAHYIGLSEATRETFAIA